MSAARKRVVFINQSVSPIGGVETWLDYVVPASMAAGWDAVVALVRGARAHNPDLFREAHPGIPVVEIDGRGLDAEGRVRAVMRALRKQRPDVVVPLTVVDAHEAVCRLKAEGFPLRYLLHVPGNVPAQIADAWRYGSWSELAACPGALTCSLLKAGGMPEERVRHLPNGARTVSTPRRERAAGEPMRLLFVGRLVGGEKRVGDLIPFLSALRQPFTMTIAGDGPLRAELEAHVQHSRLAGTVTFTGKGSQEELYRNIYPSSDVLLLFSESEAFGITLVEAMLNGVVPVSSRFCGHAAEGIVRHEENALLFNVGVTNEAASLLERLQQSPDLLVRLQRRAQTDVTSRYDWSRCTRDWVSCLEQIATLPLARGKELPSRTLTGQRRLESLGLPLQVIDRIRRFRIVLFGVPQAQLGGEEWPFVNSDYSAPHLEEIKRMSLALDRPQS